MGGSRPGPCGFVDHATEPSPLVAAIVLSDSTLGRADRPDRWRSHLLRGLQVDESADTPGIETALSLLAACGAPSPWPAQTCRWHCWVPWLDRAELGHVADFLRTTCGRGQAR